MACNLKQGSEVKDLSVCHKMKTGCDCELPIYIWPVMLQALCDNVLLTTSVWDKHWSVHMVMVWPRFRVLKSQTILGTEYVPT